ncbi:MAG: family 65 glycosyl hydrolase [Oscillospiraceae bacterium]|jgi:maltose phosphorylase|nr:family 65 glycosyl hydrolase [Oscillospiraceae bacterium]
MSKSADLYYAVEPWRVVENGFDPAYALTGESVFSLANEHMGVRGYFEEGAAAPSLLGSYFGGVYEFEGEDAPGGYRGVVKKTHYMVCAADWLYARVAVDGEQLRIGESHIEGFTRVLDMRTGEMRRDFVWVTQSGKRVSVSFARLLSMVDARRACQRVSLTADRPCEAAVTLAVDAGTVHRTTNRCDWRALSVDADGTLAHVAAQTKTSGQTVRCDLAFTFPQAAEPVLAPLLAGARVRAALAPGQPFAAEKRVFAQVDAQDAPVFAGYEETLRENAAHYADFWRRSDVIIEGDDINQQGIRFCLFQLHQTYRGLSAKHNIGAKGLTGEAYNGHAFWDTETYCLPYYLLTAPETAKNLLLFRHRTLAQAKRRAAQLDCAGACYPIATLNGEEACTLWQHASLQMQPSTAVAYGIWHYVRQTGDTAFERGPGLEMLIEICRYLATRGDWDAQGTGYGYYGVMGPDEFHLMVNNNYYTNRMGQKTLQYTLRVLEAAARAGTDTGVSEAERAAWRAMAEQMKLPQRPDGVFEQHEGYFSLPHIDVNKIPREQFPLYAHWSYDRIYRTDMIKQPDVLMAMFLYPGDYTKEEMAANYAYYEPRCIHESSLSPSVHSILASALGLRREAQDFFGFATRMDLDNYNRNSGEGLHLTSIAAAWVTIAFGFAGLRTDGELPSLAPVLPEGWKRYSLSLTLSGSAVRVTVDEKGAEVVRECGAPVALMLNGERVVV